MDANLSKNGHSPKQDDSHETVNAYADALRGQIPREIVEFEHNVDPYANVIPRIGQLVPLTAEGDEEPPRRPSRWLVAISMLLILVLVFPVVVQILARLGL